MLKTMFKKNLCTTALYAVDSEEKYLIVILVPKISDYLNDILSSVLEDSHTFFVPELYAKTCEYPLNTIYGAEKFGNGFTLEPLWGEYNSIEHGILTIEAFLRANKAEYPVFDVSLEAI